MVENVILVVMMGVGDDEGKRRAIVINFIVLKISELM